jgi:taurine dioxygenase
VAQRSYSGLKEAMAGKPARSATHPLVVTDPVTGRRALFINELYVTHIVELSWNESDAILRFLRQHVLAPEFQVRLRWRPNTLAFWHNLLTLHYPVADYDERRRMHRVCIELDSRPT